MKSTVTITKIGRMPSGNNGIGVLVVSLMAAPTVTQLPLEPVLNEIVLELPELPELYATAAPSPDTCVSVLAAWVPVVVASGGATDTAEPNMKSLLSASPVTVTEGVVLVVTADEAKQDPSLTVPVVICPCIAKATRVA
jgi:hypothetical protein